MQQTNKKYKKQIWSPGSNVNREVELGSHVVSWTVFRFRSQQLVLWTLLFWECVPSRLLKKQAAKCTGCFADTGEVLTVLKCILF